jgi:hypothetical protein
MESPPSKWRFQPRGDLQFLESKFDEVPPFLFRTYFLAPHSKSSHNFVRSAAIWNGRNDGDLLSRDREMAKCMLEKHLLQRDSTENNLISWTDSIVVAIDQAICKVRSDALVAGSNIRICVLDTRRVDRSIFLPAGSLMDALLVPNEGNFKRQNYDSEYVSQGELDVRGKSSATSLHALLERGLYKAFPPFNLHDTSSKKPSCVRAQDLYKAFQETDWLYEYPVQHIHWAKKMASSLFSAEWAQEAIQQAFLSLMPYYNHYERREDAKIPYFWNLGRCQIYQPSSSSSSEKEERVQSSRISPDGEWIVTTYKTFLVLIKAFPAPLNGQAKTIRVSLQSSHIEIIKDFNNSAPIELEDARFSTVEEDLFIVAQSGRCLIMWEMMSVIEDGVGFCLITHCLDEQVAHREFELLCS